MNKVLNKLKSKAKKSKKLNLLISIVILVEIIAIVTVASFAWVETISSIKIVSSDPGTVDTYVFTEAMIGEGHGDINLADYFKRAGDMHFAPASSADGKTFYFPKANVGGIYRKGTVSDKNTAYLSITFKLRADINADFFFDQVPTFSALSSDIRVSVTAYTEGANPEGEYDADSGQLISHTKIYAMSASTGATNTVVNSTSGGTGTTSFDAISAHIKGTNPRHEDCLFSVGANETKIVTINVWLQKKGDPGTGTVDNSDLSSNMSQAITISNFGITSSLTPRRVTLLATPTWDKDSAYFYAWCWMTDNSIPSRLYALQLDTTLDRDGDGNPDGEGFEHYCFDYNGTYNNTLFIRTGNSSLTKDYLESHWNDGTVWNKTEDTSIPDDTIDPTYIIKTINGSSQDDDSNKNNISDWDTNTSSRPKKSTGSWQEPATIQLAYVSDNDVSAAGGSLSATTYRSTSENANEVIETTNPSSTAHITTVHAWPGKKIKLVATCNTEYRFDGWYTDEEGTTRASANATYVTDAPSTAVEVTYYAKFVPTRWLKTEKWVKVDGDYAKSAAAAGTITYTAGTDVRTSVATVKEFKETYDKSTSVTFTATANSGYSFDGFFTTSSNNVNPSNPVTLDSNTTYYARFSAIGYNVTVEPYYTNTTGGTTFTQGNTGGTVQAGNATATHDNVYTSTKEVKYTSNVTLTASPAEGYAFVGWYTAGASGGTLLSSDASYTYTLESASAQTVYGRFMATKTTTIYVAPREDWGDNYYVRLYQTGGANVVDSDNGFVKATYDGNTGYYKATFTAPKTGQFSCLIAKDTNHTGKVPADGGYTGNMGTNYVFKHDQSGTSLTAYKAQRCIWFIISEDWLKNNLKNDGDYMQIWNGSSDTNMYRVDDNAYALEYTSISNGTNIWIKQMKSNNEKRNEWATSVQSGKSQYKETSYNGGSWQ